MGKKQELIKKLANRVVYGEDKNWAMDIEHFDWVPAVGIYGIWHAWKSTNDEKYKSFLSQWFIKHLKEAPLVKTVNSTAPLLTAIELYAENQDSDYLKMCIEIANYVITEAPLTREGGLEHTVTEAVPGFTEQIWADTLFMVCIFLAKLGKVTGESKYTDFALRQLEIHHRLLKDKKTNLYYHGWNCGAQNHMSAIHWGRANAWILYSSIEILETTGKTSEHQELIKAHAEALRNCQRENGAFGTILDDNSAYDELSATAAIAAALAKAIRLNILDDGFCEMQKKAVTAVVNNVNENGELEMVSSGTPVMADAAAYKSIPICPTLYGQGLAILALVEDLNR